MSGKHSPIQIKTLTTLGWSEEDAGALLDQADETNDHPDWSEASDREIYTHFRSIEISNLLIKE